jgi:hypothetical protein
MVLHRQRSLGNSSRVTALAQHSLKDTSHGGHGQVGAYRGEKTVPGEGKPGGGMPGEARPGGGKLPWFWVSREWPRAERSQAAMN